MDDFNDTISTGMEDQLETVHNDLNEADDSFVAALIEQLAEDAFGTDIAYLDDIDVHTIDRAGDSPHNHVNQKEIVSGDATAWFAVNTDYGEEIEQVDIQYGVYAGESKDVDGFIYDPVEVVVEIK